MEIIEDKKKIKEIVKIMVLDELESKFKYTTKTDEQLKQNIILACKLYYNLDIIQASYLIQIETLEQLKDLEDNIINEQIKDIKLKLEEIREYKPFCEKIIKIVDLVDKNQIVKLKYCYNMSDEDIKQAINKKLNIKKEIKKILEIVKVNYKVLKGFIK